MTTDRVREIVAAHTRLAVDVATLSNEDDLYRAGLTSHASVNLMLALEDAFDIEFPECLLRRQTFEIDHFDQRGDRRDRRRVGCLSRPGPISGLFPRT